MQSIVIDRMTKVFITTNPLVNGNFTVKFTISQEKYVRFFPDKKKEQQQRDRSSPQRDNPELIAKCFFRNISNIFFCFVVRFVVSETVTHPFQTIPKSPTKAYKQSNAFYHKNCNPFFFLFVRPFGVSLCSVNFAVFPSKTNWIELFMPLFGWDCARNNNHNNAITSSGENACIDDDNDDVDDNNDTQRKRTERIKSNTRPTLFWGGNSK